MKLFVPFDLSKADDDQRIVEGYASTEALDSQGEVVKRDAMERALPDYMRFGNIREMHQPSAVGVAVTAEHDDVGLKLTAKIVDPLAWEKVKAGVYKGFSIGGRVTNRDKANKSVITGLHLTEISIVDRPANPEALFDVWKAEGTSGSEDDTAKGMWNVARLAEILGQIKCEQQNSEWEEEFERDNSTMPDALKQWLKTGGQLLVQMAAEETAELAGGDDTPDVEIIALADKAIDLAKGGKRNSKADQKKLNEAHDAIVQAGAECDGAAKHDHTADLAKAQDDLTAANDALAKANADLATANDDLAKARDGLAAASERLAATEHSLATASAARDDLRSSLELTNKVHGTLTIERDSLVKQVETLTAEKTGQSTEMETLKAENERLKAQPEPIKGKLLSVAKGEEVATTKAVAPPATNPAVQPPEKWFTAGHR